MMEKKVTLYGAPSCPWCVIAQQYLKENNIKFTEYNVATNAEKYQEMVDLTQQNGVPVITVDDEVIVGFNKAVLAKKLHI